MREGTEARGFDGANRRARILRLYLYLSCFLRLRLSLREGTFYRIRNSTVRVQPIIWFIPQKRVCTMTVKGKRNVERKSGGGSPRCVLSGWNLFLSPSPRLISFSSLFLPSCAHLFLLAFSLSPPLLPLSCVLYIYSSSFPALFPRKLQSMPWRRTM